MKFYYERNHSSIEIFSASSGKDMFRVKTQLAIMILYSNNVLAVKWEGKDVTK